MSDTKIENSLRVRRDEFGLSQLALAERVGVSRQAIIAIEAGKQVPSAMLALQLAQAFGCDVEDLFRLSLTARSLEVSTTAGSGLREGDRVALGRIDSQWIAHALPPTAPVAADGIVISAGSQGTATVRPLFEPEQLSRNVLVAGCAPLVAVLGEHVGGRFHDARVGWLPTASHRALDFLRDGLVHVAGVHFSGGGSGGPDDNVAVIRQKLAGTDLVVVNLTRWRQGFVVAPGNPLGIHSGADLLRPGLRVAMREEGAGSRELLARVLAAAGGRDVVLQGPVAHGHEEVAWHVRCGGADVGIAIESVALGAGLGFVPLSEERFDLVVTAALAETAPVGRLIDVLGHRAFRADVERLPGYDGSAAGDVITLDAA